MKSKTTLHSIITGIMIAMLFVSPSLWGAPETIDDQPEKTTLDGSEYLLISDSLVYKKVTVNNAVKNAVITGGTLTGSTYNGLTITSTTGTLTIPAGVTITAPSTSGLTMATLTGTETLTNKTFSLTNNTLTATSLELKTALSDETGSGAAVFATSPTLVTPVLGVASATSVNKVTITAPATSAVLTIADGKTATVSNTLTFTGTDASSVAFGAGGTVAYTGDNLSVFASTTSAQLAGVLSNETGTGSAVFANTPTLVTPVLGVATATSINKMAITAPATSSTLAVADGKTFTVSNSITLAGTDGVTLTGPSTNATLARTDAAQTFTGTQTFTGVPTITNTTASTSSSTGSVIISGGVGIAKDSFINTVRVGRGPSSGANNVVVGIGALASATTGVGNTALGSGAMASATSGNSNTAVGHTAGSAFTTAASNVAVGALSLTSTTTGASNAAVGTSALTANTTGIRNASLGASSVGSNTTGSNNTGIGYLAGFYQADGSTPLANPENSVYIGALSRGFSDADDNSIVIGYGAIGEGANTTVIGNSSTTTAHIYGTLTTTSAALTTPVLTGNVTGTYNLAGTPTITAAALSGTFTGTYTLAGTGTLTSPTINTATLTSPTATGAVIRPKVTTITGDGAITIESSIVKLTKGSAAAITIAAPSSQDGTRITITSHSDAAHVVTFTGGTLLDGTTGANTTATFAAFKGASITVIASGTEWLVESINQVTCAP